MKRTFKAWGRRVRRRRDGRGMSTRQAAQAGAPGRRGAGRSGRPGSAAEAHRRLRRAEHGQRAGQCLHVQGNVWMLAGGGFNAAVSDRRRRRAGRGHDAEPLAEQVVAEIKRLAGDKPIRWIVNTHAHPDHTGGNAKVADAGRVDRRRQLRRPGRRGRRPTSAQIIAHENTERPAWRQMQPALPVRRRTPTDTFFNEARTSSSTARRCSCIHRRTRTPTATSMVFFRKSDVVVAGDLYINNDVPDDQRGRRAAAIKGVIDGAQQHHRPHRADGEAGGRHVRHSRARPAGRRSRRRRVPRHVDDHPRPVPGRDQEGTDARAGEGGAAGARLRGALRRCAGLLDDGRVRRSGLQQPEAAGGRPDEPESLTPTCVEDRL